MPSQRGRRAPQQLAAENAVALHTFIPGLPGFCVPRSSPRAEQLLRARVFERLGLLCCIPPEQLTIEALRRDVTVALELPRQRMLNRANTLRDFEGARRAANSLLGLIENRKRSRRRERRA